MITCDEAAAALTDLLFAELDDETSARLNEHLLACDACRAHERELLALRDAVHGEPVAPDAALRARARAAVARALPVREPLWRRPVPAWAAVAAVAVCAALGMVLSRPLPARDAATDGAVHDAAGVEMPDSGVTFSYAEAFETGVRGATERADSSRLGLRSRADTL